MHRCGTYTAIESDDEVRPLLDYGMRIIDKGIDESGGTNAASNAYARGTAVVKSRLKQAPPPNSLRYYRKRAGKTLMEIAAALNTNHQTIGKLENRQSVLTLEWADRIGQAIGGVPAKLIGFSYAPDAYMWAASAVSVIGTVNSDLSIEPAEQPFRKVGISNRPAGTVAIELGREALAPMAGWLILIDGSKPERMSRSVLERQNEQSRQFIVRTKKGATWWRRIVPSAKRNCYHLEFDHKPTIYDVEIESVSEFIGFEAPGLALPPVNYSE